MPDSPALAFIALGSNLGDSRLTLRQAFLRLGALSDHPILASDIIETVPVNCPPGSPNFQNAVAVIRPRTGQTSESLLRELQRIEGEFGRRRSGVTNEARVIDLDLIAFGEEVRDTAFLTLPHPRAHLRRFVLGPLAQVAPDFVLPGQTKTVQQLLAGLRD